MKAKAKLISTIVAMCLVITLGVFGILAVKTLNMSVGGNITFSADGLSLEVSQGVFKTDDDAEYTNITSQTGKLQAFAIDTNTKLSDIQDKIDSWANLELALDSKGDAILHFSVTNKMTTPLYVYVATTLGTNTNNNMNLTVSPNGTQISAGATTAFEITFDIIDTNINAGLFGFAIDVDFEKEERPFPKTQYKIDPETGLETTEIDYYYLEMGTYLGKPVKWKYIADRNQKPYDKKTIPYELSGYYILDTIIYGFNSQQFIADGMYNSSTYKHNSSWASEINANDYGLSGVRDYLTKSFMGNLGIISNDKVFSLIKSRSLEDLYSNITKNGGPILESDKSFSMSLTGEYDISLQKDKFWLMSQVEAETFFANESDRSWGGSYWLRSPANSDASKVVNIRTNGNVDGGGDSLLVSNYMYVRPCFKI